MLGLQIWKDPRRQELRLLVQVVLCAGLLTLYFFFDPLRDVFFPPCPFYTLTGLYCPGCGTQRALHTLLHGGLQEAIGYNALAVAALPVLFYAAVAQIAAVIFRRPVRPRLFHRPWFIQSVLVAVVVFWILRNLPFPCCQWLAP